MTTTPADVCARRISVTWKNGSHASNNHLLSATRSSRKKIQKKSNFAQFGWNVSQLNGESIAGVRRSRHSNRIRYGNCVTASHLMNDILSIAQQTTRKCNVNNVNKRAKKKEENCNVFNRRERASQTVLRRGETLNSISTIKSGWLQLKVSKKTWKIKINCAETQTFVFWQMTPIQSD